MHSPDTDGGRRSLPRLLSAWWLSASVWIIFAPACPSAGYDDEYRVLLGHSRTRRAAPGVRLRRGANPCRGALRAPSVGAGRLLAGRDEGRPSRGRLGEACEDELRDTREHASSSSPAPLPTSSPRPVRRRSHQTHCRPAPLWAFPEQRRDFRVENRAHAGPYRHPLGVRFALDDTNQSTRPRQGGGARRTLIYLRVW